jgi:hypothetical protein
MLGDFVTSLRFGANKERVEKPRSGGHIANIMVALKMTQQEFGGSAMHPGTWKRVSDMVADFKTKSPNKASAAFDVVEGLPALYVACFSGNQQWTDERRLQCWVAFLLSFVLMARASCLSTYCPLIDDITFPDSHISHAYDSEGVPMYVNALPIL